MNKKILVMGLLLGIVLLSGCIQVEFREVINADGMSDVTLKVDMSAFASMPGAESMDNPCDNMTTTDGSLVTDTQCTYENGIVTMTGKLNRAGQPGFTMEEGKYRLDIKEAFAAFSDASAGGQTMPDTSDPAAVQQAKAMGIVMDYYVKMPGSVTDQSGGELQSDGSVKFDMLDLPDGAFVESNTTTFFGLDQNMAIILALVIGVAIIIVAIVLLKR